MSRQAEQSDSLSLRFTSLTDVSLAESGIGSGVDNSGSLCSISGLSLNPPPEHSLVSETRQELSALDGLGNILTNQITADPETDECEAVDSDWYPPGVNKQSFIFDPTKEELPQNPLRMPTIGNGHIACVVYRDTLCMNGFYNGAGRRSGRATIPALNRIQVMVQPRSTSIYSLDCIKGVFTHTLETADLTVNHVMYAHRTIPNLMVNELTAHRRTEHGITAHEIVVSLKTGTWLESSDLDLEDVPANSLSSDGVCVINNDRNVQCFVGAIVESEVSGDTSVQIQKVYICMDELPNTLRLPSDLQQATFTYIMSVSSSKQQCVHQYNKGRKLADDGDLLRLHIEGWARLWQSGRIDIWSDDLIISRSVYGCQYYMMSSLPSTYESDCLIHEFYGLSSESLAYVDHTNSGYAGHFGGRLFWDQELWMYPPVLLLHPEIAEHMIHSRLRVIEQAKKNAENLGLQGTHFPFQQCATGIATTGYHEQEKLEIHLNGAIAFALRLYFYAGGLITAQHTSLALNLARYWVSRLTWMEDEKKFGIMDVMISDTRIQRVNNCAYTNSAAYLAITLPDYINSLLEKSPSEDGVPPLPSSQSLINARFPSAIMKKFEIYVPFDKKRKYHPLYDGYKLKDPKLSQVYRSNVSLIGYPLDLEPDPAVRRNDLEMYEKVTVGNRPMLTSFPCVGYLELNMTTKADEMFMEQLRQNTSPFQVWSSRPEMMGSFNFVTGMGGFLQSLLNGYMGVRLKPDCMRFLPPTLPPSTSRLQVSGLSYKKTTFTVNLTARDIKIKLTGQEDKTTTSIGRTGTPVSLRKRLTLSEPLIVDLQNIGDGLDITVCPRNL